MNTENNIPIDHSILKKRNKFWFIFAVLMCLLFYSLDSDFGGLFKAPLFGFMEKSGTEILEEVGKGITKSYEIELTKKQMSEITDLIKKNPTNYGDKQKSLLPENYLLRLLIKVGMGEEDPKNVKLTHKESEELKKIISSNPNNYNSMQKELLTY